MTVKPLSPEALARSVARLRIALNDLSPNSWEGGTSTETLVTRWVLAEVLDELEKYRAVVEAAREALRDLDTKIQISFDDLRTALDALDKAG